MHLQHLLSSALSLASLVLSLSASSSGNSTEPEVLVVASFPENNPFGHVVNGEKNSITVIVENKSGRNITLRSIAGSVSHPETSVLVKNLTAVPYKAQLIEGAKLKVPYAFYSEFKPGDLRLNIWLEHQVDGETYRVSAYDSIVSIVEPEASILDFKLLSTYLVVSVLFCGLLYFVYLSFVPKSKKTRKSPSQSAGAPVGNVTTTGASSYQEEWIPEHHLRKGKGGKKQSGFASGTSGDELSAGEAVVTEGKRRKGRK